MSAFLRMAARRCFGSPIMGDSFKLRKCSHFSTSSGQVDSTTWRGPITKTVSISKSSRIRALIAVKVIAVLVRQELVLFIMGGVFVIETVSVILQVGSYKLRGQRIFRMAPIHHHYELKGWPEPRVIVRFWIITFILVLIGLATLKLR